MAGGIKERVYKFDNIKFLTIMLVVVGHIIESFVDKSDMFKSLFIFIYSFHMPLFIFISGLFQKRFSDTNKLKINKVAYYITLGFILKILMSFVKSIGKKSFSINFFGGSGIEWFLFIIVMFMITTYLTRKVHPAIVLSLSFVLGCVSGYFDIFNDVLYLSRYFVYLPFYLAGYYLTPELLIKFEKKLAVKIVCGIGMLLYFVLCFRNVDVIYKLRRLFTGRNPFSTLPFEGCGIQHRLLCYIISALMCMAVICFIPNIKIPFISRMGSNTLGVYFWHNAILFTLRATPFFDIIVSLGDPLYKIVLLTFAVLLTLVLSLNVFSAPLKALGKLIDKLKPKWCYCLIAAPFAIGAAFHSKEVIAQLSNLFSKNK